MEQSPLTQQSRPDAFKPKIVGLYEALFQEEHDEYSEGFWRELFLLKPDPSSLQMILSNLSAENLLHHHQLSSQQLFLRAITHVRSGHGPSDDIAFDTLTVFLESVLNKKYASPSSDIIQILSGLEGVDAVLSEFVAMLEVAIRDGKADNAEIRLKAVQLSMVTVAGAYQTGLVSYFINRDFFPALMKLVQTSESSLEITEAFSLLGLLVNYNKFEFQNPYKLRLEDFVNENIISKIVQCTGAVLCSIRDKYVDIQDDQTDGWSITGTLSYLRLGGRVQATQKALSEEEAKFAFAELPPSNAIILLSTYDFAYANKIFCINFVTAQAENKDDESPFSNFISLTSYLAHHAHRSTRTSLYSCLNMVTIQILVEDPIVAKVLCSEDQKSHIRLCRQKMPVLPVTRGARVPICAVIDVIVDGINHNLRRRLDIELYHLFLGTLLRTISYLTRTRTRLVYHWSELWRSLLALVRFFISYASDLKTLSGIDAVVDTLLNVLALALSNGEAFLPDANSYDDFFYKTVEAGESLSTFRDLFEVRKRPISMAAIEILISVSSHYKSILEEQKAKGKKNISPRDVSKIIKEGYDTLSIQTKEGLGGWERYREGERKTLLKRVARMAVADVRSHVVTDQS